MVLGPLNALSKRLLCLRGFRGQAAFQLGKKSKQAAVLFPVRRRLGEPLPAAFLRFPLAQEFQSALFFLAATAGGLGNRLLSRFCVRRLPASAAI